MSNTKLDNNCDFSKVVNIASFLMTSRSQVLYEACLRRVLEVCQQQTGRIPRPSLLVSDYELAILQAMASTFPTGQARGCYYHSGTVIIIFFNMPFYNLLHATVLFQAMYRHACRLGLQNAYRDNEHVRKIIKMAIALALLPPGRVWLGYEVSIC